jgi:hypothetical protein
MHDLSSQNRGKSMQEWGEHGAPPRLDKLFDVEVTPMVPVACLIVSNNAKNGIYIAGVRTAAADWHASPHPTQRSNL